MAGDMTPEQAEALKNMSPEQLAEMQKQNCPFCKIIAGEIPSKKIYDDDVCFAILDIAPANPGHVLIMPRTHYQIMPQVPDEEISRMMQVAKAISINMFEALGVQGTNVLVQNGPAADQRAPHFIIHVIPRKENDGMNFGWNPKQANEAELEDIAIKLMSKPIHIEEHKPKTVKIEDKPKEVEEKKEGEKESEMVKHLERVP